MRLLHIGLDSWIVQDGNYEDFATGESYRFALEFVPQDIAPSTAADENGALGLNHVIGATHEARGDVVRATRSNWVVDFGVPAFQNSEPQSWAQPGVVVSGRVYLGVDPFFYLEELKDEPGMPTCSAAGWSGAFFSRRRPNQPVDSLVLRQNELVVFDAHCFAIHRAVSTRDEKTPAIPGDRFDRRVVWDLQGLE